MSLSNNKAALFGKSAPSSTTSAPQTSTTSTTRTTTSTTKSTTTANNSAVVAAARAKKIAEAEEYRGKAENYLKTSFLQWNPDYIASAPMFERAAELYKQADDMENASAMMLKAAKSHEGYNALASVAVANTKAATFTKAIGSGREKRVAELLNIAAEFWGLSGDIQKYGETIAKAAKELENVDTKEAQALYEKSIGILCPNAQAISPIAVEILRNHFSFLVRSRLLNEAIAASALMVQVFLASQLENSAFKVLASITVIQLSQGDAVKAQQTYLQEHMNVPGYLQSRECELADNLTMAFSSNDPDKLDAAKRSSEMHYLDYEVQQLGKGLSLFDELFTSDAPVVPVAGRSTAAATGGALPGSRSDLFSKTSSTRSVGTSSNLPPAPPISSNTTAVPPTSPAAAEEEVAEEEEQEGDTSAALADLDALQIDDDEAGAEGEQAANRDSRDSDLARFSFSAGESGPVEPPQQQEAEEEELDLS